MAGGRRPCRRRRRGLPDPAGSDRAGQDRIAAAHGGPGDPSAAGGDPAGHVPTTPGRDTPPGSGNHDAARHPSGDTATNAAADSPPDQARRRRPAGPAVDTDTHARPDARGDVDDSVDRLATP
jgi:hypothetical protein